MGQRRSRASPLTLRFAPPPGTDSQAEPGGRLAKVAQEADLNRRKRDEWLASAKARKEQEEEQYRRANSVHKQAPAQSAERQAIEERLVAEAQERDNRVAMLRAEKRKGEEAACQPKPT